jgi:hypothetical protein
MPEGIHHQPLVGLHSEAPGDFRVTQADRLAGMEERPGCVEKYYPQHLVRFILCDSFQGSPQEPYNRPRMKRRSSANHPLSTRPLPLTNFP